MIERFTHNKLVWLDVVHPTTKDVREIYKTCDLPTDFSHDLTSMVPRSDTIVEKGAIKLTLDFPIVKREDINHPHEIKFIATKDALVTIRFEDITSIDQFKKEFEVFSLLKSAGKGATGAHFLFSMLQHIYTGLDDKLDFLESQISEIEQSIFIEGEKEILFRISSISRRLITFRHTLITHQKALEDLRPGVETAFSKKLVVHVDELQDMYQHLLRRIASLGNTLDDLRETNNALLSTKQNEVMKILTIMAFITFPLSLFTSLFGMNTINTPLVSGENGFWLIVGIMTFISISFFAFFKYKKWM